MRLTGIEGARKRFCFGAGTLVHTETGLLPIEELGTGSMVLSQAEAGGERAYKPVLRTVRIEDQAVLVLNVYGLGPEKDGNGKLIVTAHQPFFVVGYDRDVVDPDYYDEYMKRTGKRPAYRLDRGALLALANGETVAVGDVARIWRTTTPGLGWIEVASDSMMGWTIDLRDGRIVENVSKSVISEFATDESFQDRYEDEDFAEDWAYKCDVYSVEVEDLHTLYVGEMGAWVSDANGSEP